MYRIFLIEDDQQIREELAILLERNGYATDTIKDFACAVDEICAAAPDLVLLDLTLPQTDGHVICRELRKRSAVPIVVVTSRDSSLDELMSMNLGADDFLTKPYDPQILLAHIQSVLRRSYSTGHEELLTCSGVELDLARGRAGFKGASVELTKNELHILHLLMRHAGSIVSRSDIQNELWQSDEFVDDNTLTVNVNRLRQTLGRLGVPESFIETRRGQGYQVS